jgi:hypothetical protein
MEPLSDSVEISAAPETVFDTVSHLERMGEFSPENTGGTWQGGATGPAPGARFRGTNSNGTKSWNTQVRVVTFNRPSQFAFEVTVGPVKVARWSYQIEPAGTGSRVTESWVDRRSTLVRKLTGTIEKDRESYTRQSIRTTLDKLKAHLEQ